eukprot:s591_g25.t1
MTLAQDAGVVNVGIIHTYLQLGETQPTQKGGVAGVTECQERPFVNENRVEFQTALEQVEKALEKSDSDWFLPYEHPTIVDIQYVCSMERMVASAMFFKGLDVREEFQSIDRWLRAFEALPCYQATKGDFYSHCMALEPRYGPASGSNHRMRDELMPEKLGEPIHFCWTCQQQRSWNYRLPFKFERDLEALTQTDFTSRIHYVQASWSLLKNCNAVVRYCCRAAGGQQGLWAKGRPDRSRLADPQAAILEPLLLPLELVICTVAEEIFAESNAEQVRLRIRETVKAMPGLEQQLSVCVAYLRDRVGCPAASGDGGDLPLPSAKVLRSYLAETYRALRGRAHLVRYGAALAKLLEKWHHGKDPHIVLADVRYAALYFRCPDVILSAASLALDAKVPKSKSETVRVYSKEGLNSIPMTRAGANPVATTLGLALLLFVAVRPAAAMRLEPGASELLRSFAGMMQKEQPDPMAEMKMPQPLTNLEAAFSHLNDSNISFEDQAKEQVASMINSGKKLVQDEEVDDPKSFLARGQTCKRKCQKKMKKHLGNTCEHLEFQLEKAKEVDHAHLIDSVKNALSVCKTSAKHHQEYCTWKCWREEL